MQTAWLGWYSHLPPSLPEPTQLNAVHGVEVLNSLVVIDILLLPSYEMYYTNIETHCTWCSRAGISERLLEAGYLPLSSSPGHTGGTVLRAGPVFGGLHSFCTLPFVSIVLLLPLSFPCWLRHVFTSLQIKFLLLLSLACVLRALANGTEPTLEPRLGRIPDPWLWEREVNTTTQ